VSATIRPIAANAGFVRAEPVERVPVHAEVRVQRGVGILIHQRREAADDAFLAEQQGKPVNVMQIQDWGVPAYYEDPIIVVGAQEAYEARCRACHTVPRRSTVTA